MQLPLDQNFPEPVLRHLMPWISDIQLVPLRTIDDRLTRWHPRLGVIAVGAQVPVVMLGGDCDGAVGLVGVGAGGLVELVSEFGERSGDGGGVGEAAPAP